MINVWTFRARSRAQRSTHSTLTDRGSSAAAGALSRPKLEQLTVQSCGVPEQLQFTGQGPQMPPRSARAPEPHARRQQSATSSPERAQAPCFRLDKVCPFPAGIAQSHLIASARSLEGTNAHKKGQDARGPFTAFMWGDQRNLPFNSRTQKNKFSWTKSAPLLWKSNGTPESPNRRRKVWRTSSLLLLPHPAVPRPAAAVKVSAHNGPPSRQKFDSCRKPPINSSKLKLIYCP